MPEYFLKTFLFYVALCLVQTLAAIPWIAALDRRVLHGLRRPKPLLIVAGANLVAGLVAALSLPADPDYLVVTGRLYMTVLHLSLAADFFVGFFVLLLTFWPKGGAVALSAFREGVRQPMFWLMVIPAPVVMLIVAVLPYFTLGEDIKMVKEMGYDLLTLLGGVFVVIAASTSISDEIEGRTAVTLMSKPISRRQFLIGKFVGILMAGLVLTVILGWFLVWMFLFKDAWEPKLGQAEKTPDPGWVLNISSRYAPQGPATDVLRGACLWVDEAGAVLPGLVLVGCQVMVLLSIAVALATRLHFTLNFIICAAFYFLGHLAPVLTAVSQTKFRLVQFMAGVFDVVMPGLEHFDMSGAVVRDTPLPPVEYAWYTANVALYAVTYSIIALLFGLILFEDKDLA
jgi:ABC-type transport system involved in multi-copper enzyme maturation permease subunit